MALGADAQAQTSRGRDSAPPGSGSGDCLQKLFPRGREKARHRGGLTPAVRAASAPSVRPPSPGALAGKPRWVSPSPQDLQVFRTCVGTCASCDSKGRRGMKQEGRREGATLRIGTRFPDAGPRWPLAGAPSPSFLFRVNPVAFDPTPTQTSL